MKIIAVIVTYNRIEKLKKTLLAYSKIESGLDTLVVVDNHSSDGTKEYLKQWEAVSASFHKHVLSLEDNVGGSGGFYNGCKFALTLNPDWILVADDDAYPDRNIINNFISFVEANHATNISAVCSSVNHIDDSVDVGHRKNLIYKYGLRPVFAPLSEENYAKDYFEIDLFSYVGTFLNATVLKEVGLCNPEYFIYYDDTEHSIRMHEKGKIICVPSIKFCHDDGYGTAKQQPDTLMTWRDYYDIRNKINMFLKHDKKVACFWITTRIVMCFVKYPFNRQCQKLYMTAIKDGICGKLGKHLVYKPVFSIKNNI